MRVINMKKLILLMSLACSMHVSAQECYDEVVCNYEDSCCDGKGVYAKVLGGANFLENTSFFRNKSTHQTGYLISGSLGYSLGCGFSLEAEYAYRRNDIRRIHLYGEGGSSKHGHFQTSSYMGNLFWQLPLSWCTCWNIQPYFGAGAGYDLQQMHAVNSRVIFNQKWKGFSWQLMTGLAYPICCNMEIDLEYRFHQGGCHFNSNRQLKP